MTATFIGRVWPRLARALAVLGIALFTAFAVAAPAMARTHVFLGVGVGWPYYYYPPPYYYYPPPYYYYAPPPVYYYVPAPVVTPQTCRQFSGDATNDQTQQPFYGTACLWPDGRWHIVN